MCAVSAVTGYWQDRLPEQPYYPTIKPFVSFPEAPVPQITRIEFDQLKRDVEELKTLLLAAKKFDVATNQPDCETEDKVALLKKLAKLVGVSVDEVFGS